VHRFFLMSARHVPTIRTSYIIMINYSCQPLMSRLFTSISPAEFARVLPLCRPPLGWSETLGQSNIIQHFIADKTFQSVFKVVANSGGPDSTCLLFLLNQYLHGLQNTGTDFPRRLVSLTIDHDLQTSSKTMADHAGNIAKLLGVEHITAKLPWGEPNFHTKPAPDDKIEEIARTMRYRVFFHHMMRFKSNAVAMGHHLDDQVETMLMRLGRGAGMHGLAAMRPCRRWGMGSPVEGFGLQGMKTWVVRPLLSFGKVQSIDFFLLTPDLQASFCRIEFLQHVQKMHWIMFKTLRTFSLKSLFGTLFDRKYLRKHLYSSPTTWHTF